MFFAVVFRDGFAILVNRELVVSLLEGEKNIEIQVFTSIESAYVYCCQQYTKRWVNSGQTIQPPLPRLEEFLNAEVVYINPLMYEIRKLVCPISWDRSFSVVGPFSVVCIKGICNLAAYILEISLPYVHICEFVFEQEANDHALYQYKLQQMSLSAYLPNPIQVPNNLPVNEVFQDDSQLSVLKIPEIKGFLK